MSINSLPKVDQKEYLKRYLSGDKGKKKKKDKKRKKSKETVKIIDDDVYAVDTGPKIDEELLLTGDDAPQIVGECVEELQNASSYVPRWKSIAVKDEPEEDGDNKSAATAAVKEEDMWGRKASEIKIKQEFSPSRRKKRTSTDTSPARRKDKKKKSRRSATPDIASPPRRRENKSMSSPKRRNDSSQNSPVRKERKSRFTDKSPPAQQTRSRSPVFKGRRQSSDQSPQRKGKGLSPSSPPRRLDNVDHSPPGRRINRTPDHSPPQRKPKPNFATATKRRDCDQSPPRKRNNSPPRPRTRRDSDQSPQRKSKNSFGKDKNDKSDFDQSPPRRRNKAQDQSPPRRRRNSDQSPPRRGQRQSASDSSPAKRGRRQSPRDISPPRQRKGSSCDQSPPRKGRDRCKSPPSNLFKREIKKEPVSPSPPPPQRKSRWERNSDSPPPTHKPKDAKTLDGKKAGLQDAKALKMETNERRRQEDLLFDKMSSDISGRNAEVKVRSTGRQGRRAREAREEDPEERRQKEEREQRKREEYERFGKGIKQLEDYKKRLDEIKHESNKPLARYSNDDDLERHLKDQERAEDPMLEYMRKKRKDKEKESGKPQKPQYEGPFPENRFGIRPGHRWDGVDRSNGYEKKWFDVQNAKKATQDEAYKYSVEDM